MNAEKVANHSLTALQYKIIMDACKTLAPSWPLDESIAVNPFWNMRDEKISAVSAKLSALGRVNTLMPMSYYMEQLQAGVMTEHHLKQAAEDLGLNAADKNVLAMVNQQSNLSHWHNVSDLLDSHRENKVAWRDEITHQISQFCAAYFQHDSPLKPMHSDHQKGLYSTWLGMTQQDRGIAILMGEPKLNQYFLQLPSDETQVFVQAIEELNISDDVLGLYMQSLLLDVNGWASWVALQNFHRPDQDKNVSVFEFLAIRLGWELALWRYFHQTFPQDSRQLDYQWGQEKAVLPRLIREHEAVQSSIWVWQAALEIAYQTNLTQGLTQALEQSKTSPNQASLQAVFCIDVRSEAMRRALEQQDTGIQTFGFAGFFGMPIEYAQQGSQLTRPHLPGLIKAPYAVQEEAYNIDVTQARNAKQFNLAARLQNWSQQPSSMFSMVEAGGLLYGFKLLKNTFTSALKAKQNGEWQADTYWALRQGHRPVTLAEKCTLVANALKGMGLTKEFADTVLLVGHESQGTNNPHQHSLHCGACGGQSGELNVRVFCQLANDAHVRHALTAEGIDIPLPTVFVPVVHNTSTQDMRVVSHDVLDGKLISWLEQAQRAVQKAHAIQLGLSTNDVDLAKQIRAYSQDWSQVRPEWGLANNASFIIAPRSLTTELDLDGRTFLHDYDANSDEYAHILEGIMSAPMIVTNWINMQYNASVLDNLKYGSGNKVLHNVVGGNIGVFEGNGGDLRIGLPKQSVHDGEKWMHQPLRLSVFIMASCDVIETIINGNSDIQHLVNNHWLHIFQLDKQTKQVSKYTEGTWQKFAGSPVASK